ncbi:hypothetical protein G5I_06429 [Acromyrmex echinatior]|uniref:Uncharacterized protein n=1 Tax=Acromyrmex echinatior TaxID=103372 RepID=F4WL07_ACREC|nr:hypothetical protein G5I_06429 [Acromyrmex echinatior]
MEQSRKESSSRRYIDSTMKHLEKWSNQGGTHQVAESSEHFWSSEAVMERPHQIAEMIYRLCDGVFGMMHTYLSVVSISGAIKEGAHRVAEAIHRLVLELIRSILQVMGSTFINKFTAHFTMSLSKPHIPRTAQWSRDHTGRGAWTDGVHAGDTPPAMRNDDVMTW